MEVTRMDLEQAFPQGSIRSRSAIGFGKLSLFLRVKDSAMRTFMTRLNLRVLYDIRFWILLFFLIRLTGIINPPLEVTHNWRQTTVLMVARNFYETDPNILYPRVDFAGNKSGITGMEFPLLNYLHYIFCLVFGYSHWYGRLINLTVSSLGVLFFNKIVRRYFNGETAFYASLVLLSSIWFSYSRKIMPDTFSMSLVLVGFYFGARFLDTERNRLTSLFLYFVFMLTGIISKLPSGYILILFLLFLSDRKITGKLKISFIAVSVMLLIPVYWWYFYWVPNLVERFGFWHFFMGTTIAEGARELGNRMNDTLANFYDTALKFVGFAFFLFGAGTSIFLKNKRLLLVLLLSVLTYTVVVLKGGTTFALHAYYIVPFVPVMALFCGYGISKSGPDKVKIFFVTIIILEGVLNQKHDFFLKTNERKIASLEVYMDRFTRRGDLIVVNSGDYPTALYFSHRKGWLATNEQLHDDRFMKDLRLKGCRYALIMKQLFGSDTNLNYQVVFTNDYFSLYRL